MKVKICGLTRIEEAQYLNEAGADYAGFVFYPPSKRNVTFPKAQSIMRQLNPSIQKVAVTVSPDDGLIEQMHTAGFDIIQIHGELSINQIEAIRIPIWYAINFADEKQFTEKMRFVRSLPKEQADKLIGIVVDGAEYGSGRTFDWKKRETIKAADILKGRKFILAGGLNVENVGEGIKRFAPDIVDVSSGVEASDGKDKEKIKDFIRKVKDYE